MSCELGTIGAGASATVLVRASVITRPGDPHAAPGSARTAVTVTSGPSALRAGIDVPISEPAPLSDDDLNQLIGTARACAGVVTALVPGGRDIPYMDTVLEAEQTLRSGDLRMGYSLLFTAMRDLAPQAIRNSALLKLFTAVDCVGHMALLVPPAGRAGGAPSLPTIPPTFTPNSVPSLGPTLASSSPTPAAAADISGEYKLAVTQATCDGLDDCGTIAGEDLGVHLLVSDCVDTTCQVINLPGVWASSFALSFDGRSWTAAGTETPEHGFYCFDTPRPTAFTLVMTVSATGDVTGTFSERTTTDVVECGPAAESFTLSGGRS